MIRRILTSVAIILPVICFSAGSAFAADNASYSVELNGTKLAAPAYDEYGSLQLPLRAVGEALGYTVDWSAKDHTVTLSKAADKKVIDTDTSSLTEGDHQYYIDSQIIDGRTYVGTDFLNDSLGLRIALDRPDRTVKLESSVGNGITVKTVNETDKEAKIDITLQYPQISGLADKAIEDKINSIFKQEAASAKQEGLDNIKNYPDDPSGNRYETFFDYRVKYNQNNLLSVIFQNYQYTGGAHGSTVQTAYTFDLRTGKEYALKDLFKADADYVSAFNSMIKEEIKARQLDEITTFASISTDQAFYLDNSGVTVYFQQYEYFPYAAGIQAFTLDYAELKDLLNPELGL